MLSNVNTRPTSKFEYLDTVTAELWSHLQLAVYGIINYFLDCLLKYGIVYVTVWLHWNVTRSLYNRVCKLGCNTYIYYFHGYTQIVKSIRIFIDACVVLTLYLGNHILLVQSVVSFPNHNSTVIVVTCTCIYSSELN